MTRAALATVAVALVAAVLPAPAGATRVDWYDASESAPSPDGRNLYVSGPRTFSFAVDPATAGLTAIGHTEPGGRDSQIAVSPDGQFVYTTTSGGIHVLSRDASTGLLTHEHTYTGERTATSHRLREILDIALSRDGRNLYVAERDPAALTVLERDPGTGALSERQAFYEGPIGYGLELALSPDDRNLYVSGGGVGIFARDPATGLLTAMRMQDTGGSAFRVAVAPDGARVYAGMAPDYGVFARDGSNGDLARVAHADMVYENCNGCGGGGFISVAPDNRAIFSGQGEGARLVQAAPHDTEGATFTRAYEEGFGPPEHMSWISDGSLAFVLFSEPNPRRSMRLAAYRYTQDGLQRASVVGPEVEVPDFDPKYRPPGISIEDGALYTNTRDVQVTVTAPPGISSLRLSNLAGDFTSSKAMRVSSTEQSFPWRLATTGPERSVKRVHVRFTGGQTGAQQIELFDDIVLDERPPELIAASISGSRLLLRARDNRSGVKRVQVTSSRKKPGKSRAYKRTLKLGAGSRSVHVRVIDGAGNRSKWRTARRP